MELAKNPEYDSARCPDHEKVYINPLKIQFLRSKFFVKNLVWKKVSLKLETRTG